MGVCHLAWSHEATGCETVCVEYYILSPNGCCAVPAAVITLSLAAVVPPTQHCASPTHSQQHQVFPLEGERWSFRIFKKLGTERSSSLGKTNGAVTTLGHINKMLPIFTLRCPLLTLYEPTCMQNKIYKVPTTSKKKIQREFSQKAR